MKAKDLGIAVVGSGRIGTLRARLAARHPAVRFLAVSDKDPPLGNQTRARLDFLSTGRPSVHARPEQAMLNLKTTYAIERAAATGQVVRLDRDS